MDQSKKIEQQTKELKLINYLEKKINKLKRVRAPWESVWHEIANCIDPFIWLSPYSGINNNSVRARRGKFKSAIASEAYDSITSLETLLCSKSVRWAGIEIGAVGMKALEDSAEWQNFKNDVIMSNFYKVTDDYSSGFYQSTHKLFTEAFLYGTACRHIRLNSKRDGSLGVDISFDTPPINRMLFEKNFFGEVVFAAQEMKLSIEAATQLWGHEVIWGAFNITSYEQYIAQSDIEKDFIHLVMERGPYNPSHPNTRFVGYVVNMQSRRIIANTEDVNYMPYNIFKLLSNPGEYYGRGLTFYLIDEIEYTDRLWQQFMQAAEYNARPPFLVAIGTELPDGGILPGSVVIGARDPAIGNKIERLDFGPGIQISKDVIELKRNEIHNNIGLFGNMLSQQGTTGMTETQVRELMVAHDNRIAPVAVAWQADDMLPTSNAILRYVFNPAGGGVEFPYDIFGIDQDSVGYDPVSALKITYSGLLGREQKKHDNFQISSIIDRMIARAQIDPSIMDNIDLDKAFRVELKNIDLTDSIQRNEDEVNAIREARQRAQNEAEEIQGTMQGMEAAVKIAKAKQDLRA